MFDCERTVPAKDLVSLLYLSLCITLEALSSIAAPVYFPVPDCASADAARLLAVAEAFGSLSVAAAFDATSREVRFVFLPIKLLRRSILFLFCLH